MELTDKNETLRPPEGSLYSAYANGAYLRVEYRQRLETNENFFVESRVVVFLNDQGREVIRTEERHEEWVPVFPSAPPASIDWSNSCPRARWYRLCAGFWLALEGLREMGKCLR